MSRTDFDAAIERIALALSRNPGSTLRELVDVAQIPRATFYRWFSDRESLERQLDLWCMINLEASLERAVPDGLTAALTVLVDAGALVRYVYVRRELLAEAPDDPVARVVTQAFITWAQAEKLEFSAPELWFVESVDALIYAAWRYSENSGQSTEDCVQLLLKTIRHGLMNGAS